MRLTGTICIVVFGEACRSALDFIELGNVSGCEWVPRGRCIFEVWSDQKGIGKSALASGGQE